TTPDGGRTLYWAIGNIVHEIKTAIVLDAGVWKDGTIYVAGDGVTLGGSFFIAQTTTTAKPGKSDEWRLAVKRGSDGRDARSDEKRAAEIVRFKYCTRPSKLSAKIRPALDLIPSASPISSSRSVSSARPRMRSYRPQSRSNHRLLRNIAIAVSGWHRRKRPSRSIPARVCGVARLWCYRFIRWSA